MHADKRLSQMAIFYVAILLFFSVGAISTAGFDWYTTLTLPVWAPNQLLTAVIWLSLFLCTAASMSLFWGNATGTDRTRTIFFLYSGSAGLVLLWNYLFFGANELTAAFIAAILVAVSLLVLTASLWKVHRSSALFLGPFLIWMAFALVFSYQVMTLN